MKIFKKIDELKNELAVYQDNHKLIGLVPTMGAIHDGHISLIKKAKSQSDIVVVTIFVNQKQFNDKKDYLNYPQELDFDIKKLQGFADILFAPNSEDIYSKDFTTKISLSKLSKVLCGKSRLGHFDGVALIITKLFNIIKPDLAFFGEKDFQQLQIIKRLVLDLNFDTRIIGCEIIRQENGLAMSSRNSRLGVEARGLAVNIYKLLHNIKKQILEESRPDLKKILHNGELWLKNLSDKFGKIDYLEIRREDDLAMVKKFDPQIKSRIFIAVYLDNVRLIDNLKLY